jgi:CHAT domain-containing protein
MNTKILFLCLSGLIGVAATATAGLIADTAFRDLNSIRSRLGHGEILLEYEITDSSMVIRAISKGEKKYFRQTVDPGFHGTIRNYIHQLKMADIPEMADFGWRMYNILLSPLQKVLAGKHRLIIIPGRELMGIAFESFLTREPDPGSCGFPCHHYLICEYEVTYHYSVNSWLASFTVTGSRMEGGEGLNLIDFAGFSPGFDLCPAISPLPESGREVSQIAGLFGSKGLTTRFAAGGGSSKRGFLEGARRSRIIHIATHCDPGRGKRGSSALLFADAGSCGRKSIRAPGILTLNEITGMKLCADLVVLNACASAAGTRSGDPGMTTLPAGFLCAGAKNILATLWNITDQVAGRFMVNFYRKWLAGMSYSRALRETKIEMIACRDTSLPTLWAAWVLIGR